MPAGAAPPLSSFPDDVRAVGSAHIGEVRERRHQQRSVLALGGVALLALAACGSSGQPSSFCKAVDSLDAAVTQIDQTSLSKSTIAAVQASVSTIDKAVAKVSSTVLPEFASDVDAVKAAAVSLDTAVSIAVGSPTAGHLASTRAAMQELSGAVHDLAQGTSFGC